VQNVGECDIECPYSPIYKPVCSSNDYTLANEEALKCRQILQPYSSECSHSSSIITYVLSVAFLFTCQEYQLFADEKLSW
jgi:hypothetical protein